MPADVLYIDSVDRAGVLLKPLRIDMLRLMEEPRTCSELGQLLGETPQKVYYHVKCLERADMVERCGERQVRGVVEGFYRARARSYWLAPTLVRRLGGVSGARDHASLGVLLGHAERMLDDAGRLSRRAAAGEHVPSLSLAAEVELPSVERRSEFLRELSETFEALASKYGARGNEAGASSGRVFRLTLACYPRPREEAA